MMYETLFILHCEFDSKIMISLNFRKYLNGFLFISLCSLCIQASGNKVSRQSVLCGSQNIVLNGKVLME
jgi:hypothetical protein